MSESWPWGCGLNVDTLNPTTNYGRIPYSGIQGGMYSRGVIRSPKVILTARTVGPLSTPLDPNSKFHSSRHDSPSVLGPDFQGLWSNIGGLVNLLVLIVQVGKARGSGERLYGMP